MCIDICPVGALTSGTYRYQTRPWEMQYVPTPCVHCSNGCKTTLSVRNNEIIRANNRDHSGVNGEFLCGKGRFGFDFTNHAERIRQPLVRKNGKLEPASWEDALEEIARRLKQVHEKHGAEAIGVIGSNRTTNEENYLLNRFARVSNLGTNNLDHHRTADYAGLIGRAGAECRWARWRRWRILMRRTRFWLIGNDPSQQNPLVAWQIRSAVRHHGARLYSIHSKPIKLHRQSAQFVEIAEGAEPQVARWLAGGNAELDGGIIEKLGEFESGGGKGSGCGDPVRRGICGRRDPRPDGMGVTLQGETRLHGAGRLHQFARRGRYGRISGPAAGLCAAGRCRRAQAVWETCGAAKFPRSRE